ncbi:MAG: hypothetical protein EBY49_05730, partial [Actinobacteria bacterium]|nr:hypothetical protein [Actinomycetota bacterium]
MRLRLILVLAALLVSSCSDDDSLDAFVEVEPEIVIETEELDVDINALEEAAADAESEVAEPAPIEIPDDALDLSGMDQVALDIQDNAFTQRVVVVSAGTEITWTNQGRNEHNVRPAVEGAFESAAEPEEETAEPEPAPEDDAEAEPEPEPEEPADDNPLDALRVPQDFATIQQAVDAAEPGDLVLIDEGVYNESVVVETDNIVIRGVDRQTVVLDGEHSEEMANGIIVFSNGVAVENLTVKNYFSNGVFFTGDYDSDFILRGYRVSYVNALNNRVYGIYAFNAEYGLIDNTYAAGHTDSGYYVGQCQPCSAVLSNNLSEYNTLAYSGTNAGGDLFIVNNEFRMNRIGVTPNTLNSEELAPQRGATFAGNWIHSNGNPDTPKGGDIWELAYGVGMVLPGANNNLVSRNLIENNRNGGVAISFMPDGD